MTARTARGGRRSWRRGVTLMELLVVLAVLAAILTMSLPMALRSLERSSFESAQAAVVAALQEARAHAQREGVMVEVVLDPQGRRITARERGLDGATARRIDRIEVRLEAPLRLLLPAYWEQGGDGGNGDGAGVGSEPVGGNRAGAEEGGGVMALFLPDGSAPLVCEALLRFDDRTEAVISMGRFVGPAESVERLVVSPDAEPETDSGTDRASGRERSHSFTVRGEAP